MSTKTTIKRVALVAAVALTLGGFSAVSASAAPAAVTGIAVSNTAYTAPASTTPGTAAVPVTATVVANSTFHIGVASANAATETATVYSDSAFTTTSSGLTVGSVTAATGGVDVAFTAGSTTGTYYVKLDSGAIPSDAKGYAAITVVNALATTYDGTVAGIGSATVNGVAGVNNTVTLTVASHAAGAKAGFISVSGSGATIASIGSTTLTAGAVTGKVIATGSEATVAVVINTPNAGAVSVTYAAETTAGSGIAGAVSDTIAITVAATGSSGVLSVANSSVYDTTSITNASVASANLTSAVVDGTFSTTTPVVAYNWSLKDVLKATLAASTTTKLSVVVTGPGVVSTTSNSSASAAKALVVTSGSTGQFYLYGDGSSGPATVTVSLGSTVLATKSVTFYSTTVASLTPAVVVNYVGQGAGATSDVIEITAKDSQGNVIKGAVISATADTTNAVATIASSATTDATGVAAFAVTGTALKSGAAKFNFTDSTGLIKTTATTNVSDVVAKSVAITTDVASAAPGDKITYTLTALDANGLPLADGTYTFFKAKPVLSVALGSNPFDSTTVTLANGKATSAIYAPAAGKVVASWTLVGTLPTAPAVGVASGPVGAAIVGTTITTSVDVSGSADSALAVDAANAATDAANAAAEEASNATEAASEALAAVNALATTVASLIAGIKAQLTALTALVKKLQK